MWVGIRKTPFSVGISPKRNSKKFKIALPLLHVDRVVAM
jgi:hypothetical protein